LAYGQKPQLEGCGCGAPLPTVGSTPALSPTERILNDNWVYGLAVVRSWKDAFVHGGSAGIAAPSDGCANLDSHDTPASAACTSS